VQSYGTIAAREKEMKRLTEKQRRFVDAYMGPAQGNGTEAARLAGYRGSDDTPASVARENLRKPLIRKAVDARVEADPAVADRDRRQRFWTWAMLECQLGIGYRLEASEPLARSQGDSVERRTIQREEAVSKERRELEEQRYRAILNDPEASKYLQALNERLLQLAYRPC
jgi:hypothetical protein